LFDFIKMVKIVFSVRALVIVAVVIVVLLGVGIGVHAYGTNNPPVMGHSMEELEPPAFCGDSDGWLRYDSSFGWRCVNGPGSGVSEPVTCTGANKVLQWTGSSWSCATVSI